MAVRRRHRRTGTALVHGEAVGIERTDIELVRAGLEERGQRGERGAVGGGVAQSFIDFLPQQQREPLLQQLVGG